MALTGHLHPLRVHFPIALILVAAIAEFVAVVTAFREWQTVAAAKVRAGDGRSLEAALVVWVALFSAAVLVAVAGHFRAVLVWGRGFLRA